MDITNTLIQLRDDIKTWVATNINFVKTLIPTQISELDNDIGFITDMDLTLKVHTDGLLYLFKNGEPVGVGISLGSGNSSGDSGDTTLTNLLDTCEMYINQRYSQSGGGLVTANGMFALYAPIEASKTYQLTFYNLNAQLTSTGDNNMYALTSDKTNYGTFNGSNTFSGMGDKVTLFGTNGLNATVEFTNTTTPRYVVINLVVNKGTEITTNDFINYIITLEEI